MITFKGVSKKYPDGRVAVSDVSLEMKKGETLVLLGRSGSGKTTILKMVNKLIAPTQGTIFLDDEDIQDIDPIVLRRHIGYAIQHIGLFPHMTVAENVATVPSLLGWEKERIKKRVDHVLSMIGLDPYEYRYRFPDELSGGQSQAVGVARALAGDPPIVLMDEPFGALDPITRDQLRRTFLEVESVMKKTVLFVTHDIFEALLLGDRIALIDEGELIQIATPKELVSNPASGFVREFLSHHNFQFTEKEELCYT